VEDKNMADKFNPAEKMGLSKDEPSEFWAASKEIFSSLEQQ